MVEEATVHAAAEAVDPDEVIRLARTLVAIPSENPGGDEEEIAMAVVGILAELGAATEIVRGETGRPNVVALIGGGGGPKLGWNGHLDVVPAGDAGTWRRPPFAAEVEDGRLVGRGAVDMKGAVAAALGGVGALRRSGLDLAGTLELHLVADEEQAGLHGTKVLLDEGRLDQDAAIVGEPTGLQVALAERGGAWVTAIARGRAAHGSRPHSGVNAIESMARFLLRIEEVLPEVEHPLAGRPTVNAAMISGGSAPNVVADRCVVEIDRRAIPGEHDPSDVLEPFERLAAAIRTDGHPDDDLAFELRLWCEPAEAAADTTIAELCRSAVETERGRRPADVGFTGITDARFYLNDAHIPTVILGPGSLEVAHTANESVAVEELVTAARVYARVFAGFLGR